LTGYQIRYLKKDFATEVSNNTSADKRSLDWQDMLLRHLQAEAEKLNAATAPQQVDVKIITDIYGTLATFDMTAVEITLVPTPGALHFLSEITRNKKVPQPITPFILYLSTYHL